jgi:hypothetical protein
LIWVRSVVASSLGTVGRIPSAAAMLSGRR